MKSISVLCAAAVLASSSHATAQTAQVSQEVVKIGVLTDLSGFLSDASGPGAVTAVRMAAEDFEGKVLGRPIEVIAGDNLNKPDNAANLARTWFDTQSVDMIIDLGNSATALSAIQVAKERNKIAIAVSPGTTRITNEDCGPTVVHYAYDTYALAHGIANTLVSNGLDSWYFITIDFAGGHSIEKDASDVVRARGGKVVGAVRHPIETNDFSSFVLQAQGSKAKVVGFATAGGAAINAIKTANEFGLRESGQMLAGLYVFLSDVHSLGLKVAQDMSVTTSFYWDRDDEARQWSRRFFERAQRMPTEIQAANYSATMHYLKAIEAAGTDESTAVMARMRATPINDFFAKGGNIRQDGRMVHDMYLAQVKKPGDSKYAWDYYSIKTIIPGDQAFQPLSKGSCAHVSK